MVGVLLGLASAGTVEVHYGHVLNVVNKLRKHSIRDSPLGLRGPWR